MYRILSFCFGFGILGAFVCTWIAPRIISLLFTPPVSFGTNCEPAAAWATDKLIASQMTGLVFGMLIAGIAMIMRTWKRRNKALPESKAI